MNYFLQAFILTLSDKIQILTFFCSGVLTAKIHWNVITPLNFLADIVSLSA
jgi:hypothetical protein